MYIQLNSGLAVLVLNALLLLYCIVVEEEAYAKAEAEEAKDACEV